MDYEIVKNTRKENVFAVAVGYVEIFKELDRDSKVAEGLLSILDAELSLPNIPFPTMGGEIFWENIVEYNGWRLQQNMITRHARILNKDDIRIAWGTINGMTKTLDRMVEYLNKYDKVEKSSAERIGTMDEIKKLKELFDIGAITGVEYQEKKDQLLRKI